jgi:oligopeptide transport system substrate-binding protein
MPSRPSLPLLLATALLALGAAGCGPRETRVEAGLRLGILHIGNGTEPQDLDPHTVTGVPEHRVIMALLEGLVTEHPRDLSPQPGVAERWEVSPDGLTYAFHLRRDARWSNGDAVTARDFIGSWQRMLNPALAGEYAYKLFYVANAEAYYRREIDDFTQVGFRLIDDYTLEIRLRDRTPFFLAMMASHYSWWPVHLPTVERFGGLERKGTAWTRPGNFVGNGPFQLKTWRTGQVIVVERNPHYWDRDTVRLNEIHFHAIESIDTEERMFRTGQLHLTNEVPLARIDAYRRDRPEVLRTDPYLGTYFYRFNVTRPPFDDVRVRRALALAVDRESIVRNVTRGGQVAAYHFTPPDTAGYTTTARLTGDIEDARRLLAEAGYPGGRGFPRFELLYNTSENHRIIAEAIQQMWRTQLGIDAVLVNQEWKVYLDSQDNLAYQVCRAGWIADYVDPHVFLDMWITGGGNNDTGWSHAEYDTLLRSALGAPDDAARYAIYDRLEHILMEELPIMPLYFYSRVKLKHPTVRGYYPNLLDHHPYKYVYVAE